MSKKIYTNLDLKQNELQNSVLENVISFPANAREGQFLYHLTKKSFYFCIDSTGDTTLESKWKRDEVEFYEKVVLSDNQNIFNLAYIPNSEYPIKIFINGVGINFTRTNNQIIITEYTAGTIDNGWEADCYYYI